MEPQVDDVFKLPSAPGAGGLHRRVGFFSWGALLLREVDRRLGLTARVARRLGEPRQRGKVRHEVVTMVRQRVHAVALGYEDLNDHDALRKDPVVQTAYGHDRRLASASTLCRFERRAWRQWAVAIHQELVEQFIASFARAPQELVLWSETVNSRSPVGSNSMTPISAGSEAGVSAGGGHRRRPLSWPPSRPMSRGIRCA